MGGGLFELAGEGGGLVAQRALDGGDALLPQPLGDLGNGLGAFLADRGARRTGGIVEQRHRPGQVL